MKTPHQEFADNLRTAIEKAGYKPEAAILEREFNQRYYGKGVTLHGVNKWLKGLSLPRYDKILVLAKWLSVPPEELLPGFEVRQEIRQIRTRWEEGLGYQERELFEVFLNLPAPQKKVVREVILTFAKAHASDAT